MPRGRPRGNANDDPGKKTKRFEKIHQEAQKRFEQAKLNHVPLEDLEGECYAEIAISSKGTNAVHICRAILKLIEEARGVIPDQSSQLNPLEEARGLIPDQSFQLSPAPKTTSDELSSEQPLTKSEQIYADRLKYRLEMGESKEEAHIRAASEAQAYEMLVDLHRVQAERELLDELRKEKQNEKSETKEVDPDDEDGS